MDRRHFLKTGMLTTSACVFSGCMETATSSLFERHKKESPNIILVLTDDQGYGDLSCHGNPYLKTPNLDSLYSQSVRLNNFHASPTCAPTRSALMTGRHEFKNGVTHTIFERERMALSSVTLPETLKDVGYTTGIFGKWHLGDEDAYQPEKRGFDEVFIHGGGGIGQKYIGSCADVPPNQQQQKSGYFSPVIKHNGTFVQTDGFCTDVFFRQALGWINQQRKQNKPFFAYISTNAPHSPYYAPEEYTKRFTEQGLSDGVAGFYGMIENIDDNMGVLMTKLREWNMENDTLLIFMTDNGSAAGARLHNAGMKGWKGTPHEGGTRVPAFFHWKDRIPKGIDVDRLTAHIDFFPTITELTGAKLPDNGQVEGRSFLPLLKDPKASWKDRFLFTHVGRWEKGDNPDDYKYKTCAVRSERFRLVEHTQLYDMHTDPGQTQDVADQYPDIVNKMRSAYDQWWTETRPMMVNEDAGYENIPLSAYKNWRDKDVASKWLSPFEKDYWQQNNSRGIPDWKPPAI